MRVLWVVLLLAAGCVSAPDSPAATTGPTIVDTDPALPGLVLEARRVDAGTTHRIVASARNVGPHTYEVEHGCGSPWSDAIRDEAGTAVQPGEPQFRCLAFSLRPFAVGDASARAAWWNETRWEDPPGRTAEADAGSYRWTISFRAYKPDGVSGTLELEFDVRVAR